jgi:hypothetical protein
MLDQLTGLVSPIFSFAASVAPSIAPAAPLNFVSLDALSSLAGLSAALSLSYAALPNFRHRMRVQEHVRNKVRDEELIAVLKTETDLCNQESWAILYRLGRLRDVRQALGLLHDEEGKGSEIDRNFRKRLAYVIFSQIYASNFDKIATALLGCIAATVIWFGALDNIYYHDLPSADPLRIAFFVRVQAFYWTTIFLAAIAAITHKILWRWDMSFRGWRSILIHIFGWVAAFAFVLFLLGASTDVKWFGHVISFTSSDGDVGDVFSLAETILVLSVLAPLLLLAVGEFLTRLMLIESDNCIIFLVAEIDTRASTARIEPSDPLGALRGRPQRPRPG